MASRRQLVNDPGMMMRAALRGQQVGIWTALPGIVTRYTPGKMTCEVQPAIKAVVRDSAGVESWVSLPLLLDCPVVFPGAGGFSLTFPIAPGDEVLVVFSSRCIDSWWQSGGVQVQADLRLHDLSDGFAIPGIRSTPRALASPSTTDVQLRNDAGTALFSIDPSANLRAVTPGSAFVVAQNATVTALGGITLNGPVTVNGTLHVTGEGAFDSEIFVVGTKVHHHQHGGVRNGNDLSGPPQNYP